jgi:hypothetical protein
MKELSESPLYRILKELIDQEKIAPIDRNLTTKPATDLLEVRSLQGERKGLKSVFEFVENVAKIKP